jgi:hypothetical protein
MVYIPDYFLSSKIIFTFETKGGNTFINDMEYSTFSQIVLRLKAHDEKIQKLYKMGVDLIDFQDELQTIITLLIKEVYGEEGEDWFSWFCYESDYGEKDWSKHDSYKMVDGVMTKIHDAGELRYGATDKDGNPICHSIQSTWEYLEENYRSK